MRIPRFLKDFQRKENQESYLSGVRSTAIGFAGLLLIGLFMYLRNAFTPLQFLLLTAFVTAKFLGLLHLRRQFLKWSGTIFLPIFFNQFLNLVGFTAIVYFTGPFTSHFFALYPIHVMVVALYYNLESALVVTVLSTLCYGGMAVLVYLRFIPFHSPFLGQDILERITLDFILEVTFFLFIILFVISLLAYYINRRLRESMEETKRLSTTKEEFFSRVTHELRTPVHGIIGLLSLIREGIYGTITAQQQDAISMMEKSSRSLLDLVNDLLDLSKLSSGKMDIRREQVSLADVINDVSSVAIPLAREKGLSFVKDVPGDLPVLMTDKAKLHQILMNLVGNAIKFTEKGSVTIQARASDTGATISVEDTGIGIEEGNLQKIFDEFSQVGRTADSQKKGSGLGLSISGGLAKLLGGQISVRSTPGQGSIFTLTFPINPAK